VTVAGYGGQSEYQRLRRVVVRAPSEAFGSADPERWHYTGRPDLIRAREEHQCLVELLRDRSTEVIEHRAPLREHADALYVYDPALLTDRGAILLRMGKPLRRGEERALGGSLTELGVPILGELVDDALAEAGDTLWLDPGTLAVGVGYRTNREGIRQLAELVGPDVDVMPVDLPYFQGPAACLHLKSLISILDADLAVVYLELMPVALVQALERRKVRLVAIDRGEFATQGCNVLAVGPRDVIMLEGNPRTRAALERAGCRVRCYSGFEISLKAEGGPTCLTRPVWRAG